MVAKLDPKIYVACLAAYNNGQLHGVWIDADQDAEDIHTDIQAMLKASPQPNAEEWAIHDYELGGIDIGEYESIEKVAELGQALAEHGEPLALFVQNYSADDLEHFEESYQGEYDTQEDFARATYEDAWEIPERLEMYIDWQRVARDLFITDYTSERDSRGNLHVFANW